MASYWIEPHHLSCCWSLVSLVYHCSTNSQSFYVVECCDWSVKCSIIQILFQRLFIKFSKPSLVLMGWCQVLQRSLTLISPQDKRQSLALSYCESVRSSSPPKCTKASTDKAGESDVVYNIPSASRLQVQLDSTDLSDCKPAGDDNEERWVLQDIQRTLVGSGAHRVLHSTLTLSGPQTLGDGCHLRLVERLPTGVFADQFELQGIQRRGGTILVLLGEFLSL